MSQGDNTTHEEFIIVDVSHFLQACTISSITNYSMTFCIMLLSFTQNDEPMAAIVKKTDCILKPYMIFLNIVRK